MNITKTEIDALDAFVTIQLEPADYDPKVKESLKEISKKSNIKGFRAGQVPLGYLKKMYGNKVLAEELSKLVNDKLNEYIEQEDLKLIGRPVAAKQEQLKIDIKNKSNYDFKFYIGERPTFDIDLLSSDSDTIFTDYSINVKEEDVNNEIETLLKNSGKVEEVDKVENETDAMVFEFVELDASTDPKEGGHTTKSNFLVEMLKDGEIKEQIKNLTAGQSVIFNVFDTFNKEDNQILKFILNLDPANGVEQVNPIFKATLEKISRLIPAELNEDFFSTRFPNGDIDTEEKLKENIKESIGQHYKNLSNQKLFNEVVKTIIDKTEINLPQNYVDFLLEELKEDKRAENENNGETIGKDNQLNKEDLEKSIRWELIKNQIISVSDIKVEKEDIESTVRQSAIRTAIQYYGANPPAQFVDQVTQQMLGDKSYVNSAYNQVLETKLAEFVLSKINKSEEAIDLDKFQELNKEND